MSKTVIDLQNICFDYQGKKVFSDLSFSLKQGQKVLLVGSNGSGKTTLLKLLSGLLRVKKGKRILDAETDLTYKGHDLHYYLDLTVGENIAFYIDLLQNEQLISQVLSDWGLEAVANKTTRTLSKGQQQKLALAISFLNNPNLILLDEPSSNLDLKSRESLLQRLDDQDPRHTTLIASHDLKTFSAWCDQAYVLSENSIQEIDKSNIESTYLEIIK